jgi:acyl-CoA reductase-like NAD-dependent aldehyde dehydrogenase
MATTEANVREVLQFVGGEWRPAAGGKAFDDLDPYTGDVVARVPAGSREDANAAIAAAAAAFEASWHSPPAERQRIFLEAADILEARNDEIVSLPFGGVKDSGWGRFGGTAAIEEFTELRWVTVKSWTHPFPF